MIRKFVLIPLFKEGFTMKLKLITLFCLLFTACNHDPVLPPADQITSAADLAKIGVDPGYPPDGDYVLTASITVSNWKPLGTFDAPFTGTFDGGGHTITGAFLHRKRERYA
jgi:hypothetical protein